MSVLEAESLRATAVMLEEGWCQRAYGISTDEQGAKMFWGPEGAVARPMEKVCLYTALTKTGVPESVQIEVVETIRARTGVGANRSAPRAETLMTSLCHLNNWVGSLTDITEPIREVADRLEESA